MNNLILLISLGFIANPAFSGPMNIEPKESQSPRDAHQKEKEAKNKWYLACRSSKHPAIVSVRNKLYTIHQQINFLQSVSPEYKHTEIARQKFLKAKGENKWDLHEELQKAQKKWFQKSKSLDDQRLKAWSEFYAGACKSNYDPKVTKARKEYEQIRDGITIVLPTPPSG